MRRTLAASAFLASACIIVGTTYVDAGATTTSRNVPSNVKVAPWAPIPASEALPAGLEETASDASVLVDTNPDQYAGSWYDPDSNRVTISSVSGSIQSYERNSRRLANDPDVAVTRARFSLTDGQQLLDDFMSHAEIAHRVATFGVTPDGDGFQFLVIGQPTFDELAGLAELPGQVDVSTGLTEAGHPDDAMNDSSPFAGGMRYGATVPMGTQIETCSAGFPYLGDSGVQFLLSAGHCIPKGSTWKIYKLNGSLSSPTLDVQIAQVDTPGGRTTWQDGTGTVNAGTDSAKHGDVGMFNVSEYGKSVGDSIWVTNTTKRNVISRDAPSVGAPICHAGVASWETCGFTIQSVNTSVTYSSGEVLRQGDVAYVPNVSDCAAHGDSGGPVYRRTSGDAVAVGILSGHGNVPGGCLLYFTGVEEAIQAWGGDLKYH